MRETLKSLTIFSAMLLLLLLVSSGCNDVNIPGCGKRTLPFFKKPAPTVTPLPAVPESPASQAPAGVLPTPSPVPAVQQEKPSDVKGALESSTEMSITKPKAAPTSSPTPTFTPLEAEKIAYTTLEKGKPALWTMNPDGSGRARWTPPGAGAWHPLWSPSGKILAFLSDMGQDKKMNLYIVKKGTDDFIQMTFLPDLDPANAKALKAPYSWSPRSDEIAFIYGNQVWKMDLATQSHATLDSVDPAYLAWAVEWAPHRDTKFIAYLIRKGASYFALHLVNPRLMDQLKLAETSKPIDDISWSPDARKVAYMIGASSIYTASAETSSPKMQFSTGGMDLAPYLSYSPSESSSQLMVLAKRSSVDPGYCVAVLDKPASGDNPGSLRFLTEPGVTEAVWSPDGSKIAYVSNGELWVMDSASGKNKVRIAATGILSPCWSKK